MTTSHKIHSFPFSAESLGETQIRLIVEQIPAVLWTTDRDLKITSSIGAGLKGLKLEPNQLLGSSLYDYLKSRDPEFLPLASHLSALKGEATTYEMEWQGRWFHTHIEPLHNSEAEIVGVIGLALDITDQKRAGEAFEQSLSLLKATLESTTDGILVVDLSGKMVSYNQKFAEMWRIPKHILDSRDDQKALEFVTNQLKDPETFLKKVRELYDQPESESFDELEFLDGRIFERYSQPQRIGGKSVGRVWSFRDVTERRRDEEALRQKTEELARSNRELEQFAYVASHDLQEPLHKILAFGDRLKEMESSLKDRSLDYLNRMQSAAMRMRQLIVDLLQLARVTTHANPFERVDLNEVVREVISDLDLRLNESKAEVDLGALPVLKADREQMHRLFQNLIANAVKFQKKGEPVRVTIRSGEGEPGWVEIQVKDNGIGFDEKYQERIFLPFQRLHGRGEYEGSGMGLAICQKIVQRHQGELTAESRPDHGSVFKIKLPLPSDRN